MKIYVIFVLLILCQNICFSSTAVAESPLLQKNPIPKEFIKKVRSSLLKARYMEGECKPISLDGWENYPVIHCFYDSKNVSSAEVVMLNSSPEKLSSWIVDACHYISLQNSECYNKLLRAVVRASGGQFPIAGVVYEDLNANNISEAYVFRSGVTVRVKSIPSGTEELLSPKQINDSLEGEVLFTYKYARIVSTTREQYYNYMNNEKLRAVDVGFSEKELRKNTWMDVIKDLYLKAWDSDKNILIRAWALENKSKLQ